MLEVLQWINFPQASRTLLEDSHSWNCFDVLLRRTDDKSYMIKLIFLEFKIASYFFSKIKIQEKIFEIKYLKQTVLPS